MMGSGTQQPGSDPKPTDDEAIEGDPQPQSAPNAPENDDPEIEETEEQPS